MCINSAETSLFRDAQSVPSVAKFVRKGTTTRNPCLASRKFDVPFCNAPVVPHAEFKCRCAVPRPLQHASTHRFFPALRLVLPVHSLIFYDVMRSMVPQGFAETYPENPKVVSDMTSMHHIHEAGILYNLGERSRIRDQRPYTFMVSCRRIGTLLYNTHDVTVPGGIDLP